MASRIRVFSVQQRRGSTSPRARIRSDGAGEATAAQRHGAASRPPRPRPVAAQSAPALHDRLARGGPARRRSSSSGGGPAGPVRPCALHVGRRPGEAPPVLVRRRMQIQVAPLADLRDKVAAFGARMCPCPRDDHAAGPELAFLNFSVNTIPGAAGCNHAGVPDSLPERICLDTIPGEDYGVDFIGSLESMLGKIE